MKAIGLDIGGTSIKGMVLDGSGQVLDLGKIATDAQQGKDRIMANMHSLLHELIQRHEDVSGIGIGTAGRVDVHTGKIVYATDNLPGWQGTELMSILEQTYERPVFVDNDANTALVGEAWLGAGKGIPDITMLTLGTGVGGANMTRGELFRGAGWNGGEWGHTILVPGGRLCNCGQRGCVEQYLSGTALVSLAAESAGKAYSSGVEVLGDYKRGIPSVVKVVHEYVRNLGVLLHNIHIGLNPGAIVIGGGLADSREIWWPLLDECLSGFGPGIDVRPAVLGNQAGAIGAARLILNRLGKD
ncbi:ROK family protein [Paenibacillus sp. XY044]|uniref:ROK family protein n=1 Tax=Paenibacillus sp. XY044 TaxID=2026089 RepID=UPI000B981240|nr:ROK family protein [Paenibacillus sp. XY044]OZB93532.1 hypothetical protein CJP46_21265 [Paenibacillus sp. XY044]